jgi:hypothetical protein
MKKVSFLVVALAVSSLSVSAQEQQRFPPGLISSTNELTENHPTAPRGRVIFPFKYSFRKQFDTLLFGGDERWLDE